METGPAAAPVTVPGKGIRTCFSIAEMKIKCSHCGSDDVTGSRRRGLERFLCDLIPLSPYRCRECWKRFWSFHNPFENPSARIIWGAVFLIILAFFSPPCLRGRPPAGPETQLKPSVRRTIAGIKRPPPEKGAQAPETAEVQEVKGKPKSEAPAWASPTTDKPGSEGPSGGIPGTGAREEAASLPQEYLSIPGTGSEKAPAPPAVPGSPAEGEAASAAPVAQGNLPRSITLIPRVSGGESELFISMEGPAPKYDSFFVGTPPRFVIDLAGNWKNSGPSEISLKGGKARAVRVGEHEDKLRIVLDLEGDRPISPVIRAVPRGLIVSIR